MDIFTTALTRVVPVPIKPQDLKVKALVKEAATRELEAELDHLESAGSFFIPGYHPEHPDGDKEKQHQNKSQEKLHGEEKPGAQQEKSVETVSTKGQKTDDDSKDVPPHLDIFV